MPAAFCSAIAAPTPTATGRESTTCDGNFRESLMEAKQRIPMLPSQGCDRRPGSISPTGAYHCSRTSAGVAPRTAICARGSFALPSSFAYFAA